MALINCPSCGAMVSDQASICPKCGQLLAPNAVMNPSTSVEPKGEDKATAWQRVGSFIVPIAGWVLWGVWREEYPNKAKDCAKMAWIGFAVEVIINIIAYI